ncbi:hypothetical protein RB601_004052 [Gaeumannomyces tritici]
MQLEPAPVDAGQLGALLESLAADETDETDETRRRRRARSESELSTIPEPTPAEVLKAGLDSLQSLVQDGGRPAFPADLAEQVYHDPSKFLDMVRPWIAHPDWVDLPYEADIYGAQLCRWKEFREWQRNIRGLPAAENPDTIPEGPKKDFSKYAARVERHLKQRGFIQPFSLDQDLRQGMWETWVEYLYYESWYLDYHRKPLAKLESQRDEIWKQLQDMGLLEPPTTREYIISDDCARERGAVMDQAYITLRNAQQAADRAPSETANRDLDIAQKNLDAILEEIEPVGRLRRTTFKIGGVERKIRCHTARVEWIREQLLQIEADERKRPAETARSAESTKKRGRETLDGDEEAMKQAPATQRRR